MEDKDHALFRMVLAESIKNRCPGLTDEWKTRGEDGVEGDREEHDRNGQQGSVPSFIHVGGVVEDDQALNDCPDQEAHTGKIHLPTNSSEPP